MKSGKNDVNITNKSLSKPLLKSGYKNRKLLKDYDKILGILINPDDVKCNFSKKSNLLVQNPGFFRDIDTGNIISIGNSTENNFNTKNDYLPISDILKKNPDRKLNIIGVIPARYGSTRFPGKPLADINGKPMIQWVYENASKSKLLNNVIIATDDKRILNKALSFTDNVVLTSRKHKSGTDRICEVVKDFHCDIVVNIQGDEPFIVPANIDLTVKALIDNPDAVVATAAVKFCNKNDVYNTDKVKVVFDLNNYALYFSRSIIPFQRNNMAVFKHVGLYVFRKEFLLHFALMKRTKLEIAEELEQLRILENGYKIKIVKVSKDSISIDTEEDLKKLKLLMKDKKKSKPERSKC